MQNIQEPVPVHEAPATGGHHFNPYLTLTQKQKLKILLMFVALKF